MSQDICPFFLSSMCPQQNQVLSSLSGVTHRGSPARAAETRLPSAFRQLSSKEVCCTSANTTVLPSTTNSSQQLQTSFLRLGIPAPVNPVAWPGLSDGAHPVQVLRGCLTARTGRALAAGAVLSRAAPLTHPQHPSSTRTVCVHAHLRGCVCL